MRELYLQVQLCVPFSHFIKKVSWFRDMLRYVVRFWYFSLGWVEKFNRWLLQQKLENINPSLNNIRLLVYAENGDGVGHENIMYVWLEATLMWIKKIGHQDQGTSYFTLQLEIIVKSRQGTTIFTCSLLCRCVVLVRDGNDALVISNKRSRTLQHGH